MELKTKLKKSNSLKCCRAHAVVSKFIKGNGNSKYLKVNFKQPYSKKPKVFINPANLDTIPLQIYKEVTKDYFIVKLYGPLPPNKTYSFDYFVVE